MLTQPDIWAQDTEERDGALEEDADIDKRRYAALTRFALIRRRSFRMKKYPTRTGLMKNILRKEYQEINIEVNI